MHLDEIISLIKPFGKPLLYTLLNHINAYIASQRDQLALEQPPPYLSTRFARLSSFIHESLQNLSPHIHLNLSPEFVPTYQPPKRKEGVVMSVISDRLLLLGRRRREPVARVKPRPRRRKN